MGIVSFKRQTSEIRHCHATFGKFEKGLIPDSRLHNRTSLSTGATARYGTPLKRAVF